MAVVVVESPAKAKTINKYLGPDYTVLASYGHVRDLPAKDGSVNPDAGFDMTWEVAADSKKHVRAIAEALKTDDILILATDPDREGEAISWHLQEALAGSLKKGKKVSRVASTVADLVTQQTAVATSTLDDIMEHVKGPDFPTGAVIMGRQGIDDMYTQTGEAIQHRGLATTNAASQPENPGLHRNHTQTKNRTRSSNYSACEAQAQNVFR